jgi:hypothetical protein
MLDDVTVGTLGQMMTFSSGLINIDGLNVFSGGRTLTQIINTTSAACNMKLVLLKTSTASGRPSFTGSCPAVNVTDLSLDNGVASVVKLPPVSIGGGSNLTTTNQTGTGSIVLATSPTINTPTISGNATQGSVTAPLTQTIGSGTTTTNGTAIATLTSQAQPAITITGALATDTATCSLNAAMPATWQTGIVMLTPVVTANTVTVWLSNPTATATITPVATVVRCTVTR